MGNQSTAPTWPGRCASGVNSELRGSEIAGHIPGIVGMKGIAITASCSNDAHPRPQGRRRWMNSNEASRTRTFHAHCSMRNESRRKWMNAIRRKSERRPRLVSTAAIFDEMGRESNMRRLEALDHSPAQWVARHIFNSALPMYGANFARSEQRRARASRAMQAVRRGR